MKRILNVILLILVAITVFLAFQKSSSYEIGDRDDMKNIQYAARLPVPGTVPSK